MKLQYLCLFFSYGSSAAAAAAAAAAGGSGGYGPYGYEKDTTHEYKIKQIYKHPLA